MDQNMSGAPATPAEFPFLDLRYPHPVRYQGRTFPSAENAYQSTRVSSPAAIEKFRYMPPGTAAYRGAMCRADVPGWFASRHDFLYGELAAKYRDRALAAGLKATGSRPIVIANRRHENDLGACQCPACRGKGRNAMGEILMQIRAKLL